MRWPRGKEPAQAAQDGRGRFRLDNDQGAARLDQVAPGAHRPRSLDLTPKLTRHHQTGEALMTERGKERVPPGHPAAFARTADLLSTGVLVNDEERTRCPGDLSAQQRCAQKPNGPAALREVGGDDICQVTSHSGRLCPGMKSSVHNTLRLPGPPAVESWLTPPNGSGSCVSWNRPS